MNNTLLVIIILVAAIGGVGAVAYFLEKRSKKSEPAATDLPEPGSKGKGMLWGVRILVALMVLSIIGFFVFQSRTFFVVAGVIVIMYSVYWFIFRIVRLIGK